MNDHIGLANAAIVDMRLREKDARIAELTAEVGRLENTIRNLQHSLANAAECATSIKNIARNALEDGD